MNELALRSEKTISTIHDHHEEISRLQGELFSHVDRIKEFQHAIMGEFFDIKAVFYYLLFIGLSFLLTSSPRTGHARLYLIICMSPSLSLSVTFIASSTMR